MDDVLTAFLISFNEALTAAAVIIAASLLLYNITRNFKNRVARTSSIVLACVSLTFIGDVFITLGPGLSFHAAALRFQWIGIAFIPAALMHLSDALLDTTGLPSRGRRRRVIRILYLISAAFLIAAVFSDILIIPVRQGSTISLRPGYLFWLFLLYVILAAGVAVINVERARQRCLMRSTKRRMGYLLVAMLTPLLGIFPYSVLPGINDDNLLLVNIANVVVIMMLLFLAYPLSFFGSRRPDRVIRAELLRFMMLGPGTALLALGMIIFLPPTTQIFSLPGNIFMPFAVVAVILMWQWFSALALPFLEKRLIYFYEDDDQLVKLQRLSDRLLTRSDLMQLVEAILEALSDFVQVGSAFVVLIQGDEPQLLKAVGRAQVDRAWLNEEYTTIRQILDQPREAQGLTIQRWRSFWIIPLYSTRVSDDDDQDMLIGLMGIEALADTFDLSGEEARTLRALTRRMTRTLDDLLLQGELFAALEGLLPQYTTTRSRVAEVEYRPGREKPLTNGLDDQEQLVEQVRAALRHYWGGEGLTNSPLQDMTIVQQALAANDNNPTRALRAVLLQAIEKQRPEGQRRMTSPEWTLYNILQLRFVERVRVRDVAMRLAVSEPDLYRKQRVAIEVLADALVTMEHEARLGVLNTASSD